MTAKNSTSKSASPVTALFDAGLGFVASQTEFVKAQLDTLKSRSSETIDDLAARGEAVDAQIKQSLAFSPTKGMTAFFDWLPSFNTKAQAREQQLAVLSTKIDLLIEQVALLAAKEAKKQEAPAKKTTTRRKTTTTAKKTTTTPRKRTSAAKSTSTAGSSTAGDEAKSE